LIIKDFLSVWSVKWFFLEKKKDSFRKSSRRRKNCGKAEKMSERQGLEPSQGVWKKERPFPREF
jgi:hypothetical protein